MSADLDERRAELLALRARVLEAAHDLVIDDDDQSELSSASGDQHLADHASEILDKEVDESARGERRAARPRDRRRARTHRRRHVRDVCAVREGHS